MKTTLLAALTSAAMAPTLAAPSLAQDHSTMDHSTMDHSTMDHGAHDAVPLAPPPKTPAPVDHSQMDHSLAAAVDHEAMNHGADGFGAGSGTARLPAADGPMRGVHISSGDWMVMGHGFVTTQFTDHSGPRGDDKFYSTSMGMVMAGRETGFGRVQLRSMFSMEPAMKAKGYPNLFATGETAGGEPLVDRQHPHDLFMELAARIDVDAGPGSVFLYAAPVGEPAIGPSAFMMRASARYQSLSPITHHWFDSTHISYGVVTAGYAAPRFQIEASAFRGREPDQFRWDFEAPRLDSWSVRASWSPSPAWAMQVSHGLLKSPEQLEADLNERRTTASLHYGRGGLATTLAFSAKDKGPGRTLTAWLAEANWDISRHHSIFGRVENVANDELFPDHSHPLHDQRFRVTKAEGGYAYRLKLTDVVNLALGGSVAGYAYPAALVGDYGNAPISYTLFAKLSLGQ